MLTNDEKGGIKQINEAFLSSKTADITLCLAGYLTISSELKKSLVNSNYTVI